MTKYALTGGHILLPKGIETNSGILFDSAILATTLDYSTLTSSSPADKTITLPKDWIIAPGFVDLHIHGCAGSDVMDGTLEALHTMGKTLVSKGVTSYLGATMTMATDDIEQALENARSYMARQTTHFKSLATDGSPEIAKFCGIHLEGPFISKQALGAQNPTYVRVPDIQLIERYQDIIRMVTYAPEEDHDFSFTQRLSAMGIVPSIGHTACTYDTAFKAFEYGAKHMTHLFNAMTPLHHREPGAVGAALNLDYTLEIIADNVHIRPELYPLLHKLKNGKLALITDSMRAGCMKCGCYNLGGQKVIVDEHSARLENGVLAGSILTMDQALRNYHHHLNLVQRYEGTSDPTRPLSLSNNPVYYELLADALRAASTVPAAIAGLKDTGTLVTNAAADLVVLDEQLQVRMTFVEGQLCYEK